MEARVCCSHDEAHFLVKQQVVAVSQFFRFTLQPTPDRAHGKEACTWRSSGRHGPFDPKFELTLLSIVIYSVGAHSRGRGLVLSPQR